MHLEFQQPRIVALINWQPLVEPSKSPEAGLYRASLGQAATLALTTWLRAGLPDVLRNLPAYTMLLVLPFKTAWNPAPPGISSESAVGLRPLALPASPNLACSFLCQGIECLTEEILYQGFHMCRRTHTHTNTHMNTHTHTDKSSFIFSTLYVQTSYSRCLPNLIHS